MELALSICLGIGLSAACGFRVFVPLLAVSTAAMSGHLELADGFDWIGAWPALACFLTASILEVAAYYVPWLDNVLDTIALPAAVVAGTVITASVATDMSPLLQWSLALIAGGGTAGLIQSATTAVRGASTTFTGGLANCAVASTELVAATGTTLFSFAMPALAAAAAILAVAALLILVRRSTKARFARLNYEC